MAWSPAPPLVPGRRRSGASPAALASLRIRSVIVVSIPELASMLRAMASTVERPAFLASGERTGGNRALSQ